VSGVCFVKVVQYACMVTFRFDFVSVVVVSSLRESLCWSVGRFVWVLMLRMYVGLLSSFVCEGYIGEFETIDDHRAGKIVVNLLGRLNKAGVISPRFDVTLTEIPKWETNMLPSRNFGHLVFTTSYGIMDNEECVRKHTGGKLLGKLRPFYCCTR
jgi:small subunit ribosomal protein S15Ae